MYGTQIRVFEQMHQESFTGLLQRLDCLTLPSQILRRRVREDVERDFAHQSCEGQFKDEELCRLLVSSDFSQCHCTRFVSARLPHRYGVTSCVMQSAQSVHSAQSSLTLGSWPTCTGSASFASRGLPFTGSGRSRAPSDIFGLSHCAGQYCMLPKSDHQGLNVLDFSLRGAG